MPPLKIMNSPGLIRVFTGDCLRDRPKIAEDFSVPDKRTVRIPVKTKIPTLFITGTLDCRTPVEQVEVTMKGFGNAIHVKVKNAGHEQAQWDAEVADQLIPSFIKGEPLETTNVYYSDIEFIPLNGEASGHPSIN